MIDPLYLILAAPVIGGALGMLIGYAMVCAAVRRVNQDRYF